MNTLNIKDLALTTELDHHAMAAVRGGHGTGAISMPWLPPYYSTNTSSIKVDQNLLQAQDVKNLTANGSAFISGVSATNNTDQFGQNNVTVL